MTDFEDQLRRGLARREPSDDFAARVVASATRHPKRSARPGHWRRWTAAGIAASFFVVGLSVDLEHRRLEGEAARDQLLQAMQITSTKLAKIHQKVRGSN